MVTSANIHVIRAVDHTDERTEGGYSSDDDESTSDSEQRMLTPDMYGKLTTQHGQWRRFRNKSLIPGAPLLAENDGHDAEFQLRHSPPATLRKTPVVTRSSSARPAPFTARTLNMHEELPELRFPDMFVLPSDASAGGPSPLFPNGAPVSVPPFQPTTATTYADLMKLGNAPDDGDASIQATPMVTSTQLFSLLMQNCPQFFPVCRACGGPTKFHTQESRFTVFVCAGDILFARTSMHCRRDPTKGYRTQTRVNSVRARSMPCIVLALLGHPQYILYIYSKYTYLGVCVSVFVCACV